MRARGVCMRAGSFPPPAAGRWGPTEGADSRRRSARKMRPASSGTGPRPVRPVAPPGLMTMGCRSGSILRSGGRVHQCQDPRRVGSGSFSQTSMTRSGGWAVASRRLPWYPARAGLLRLETGRIGMGIAEPAKGGMVRFACHGCGATIRAPRAAAGWRGRCPKCRAVFAVPQPDAAAAKRPPTARALRSGVDLGGVAAR